jgi:hypothetical protein
VSLPAQGDKVTFRNGDDESVAGIVNGDPFEQRPYGRREPIVYIPVYVRATDQCMVVAEWNIVEVTHAS